MSIIIHSFIHFANIIFFKNIIMALYTLTLYEMNTTLISNIKAMGKEIVCNTGFIITLKGILCIEILKGDFLYA